MIRKKKKYSKPRRPFDKARIEEENVLREKYGLKNKREIWKAESAIGRIRDQAKRSIAASDKEKNSFVEKLQKKGFNVNGIPDILSLDKEDWLKRRLQTIVHKKGLTTTAKQARQLIVHKHVSIGEQIVNIPSYPVELSEEDMVRLNLALKPKEKKKDKLEKIKEEIEEGSSERNFIDEISNGKRVNGRITEQASKEHHPKGEELLDTKKKNSKEESE